MKPHKGCKARMRLTRNGKLVHRHPGVRHLMTHRSPKKKRQLRQPAISNGYAPRARLVLGKDA